jgi:hypothetical protein
VEQNSIEVEANATEIDAASPAATPRDAKAAGGICGCAVRCAHQLHHHVRERFAAARVHNGAAHFGDGLGAQYGNSEKQQSDLFHWG